MANPKMNTGFSFSQVFDGAGTAANDARELENKINGPQMDDKRYGKYIKEVQKREKTKPDMKGKLFGQYLPGKKKKK